MWAEDSRKANRRVYVGGKEWQEDGGSQTPRVGEEGGRERHYFECGGVGCGMTG